MLQALRFLTPLAGRPGDAPGRSVVWFPMIGAGLGWLGAWSLGHLVPLIGQPLAVLIVLAMWSTLTGARQERGAIRSLNRVGILAVLFLTVVRWHAMLRLPPFPIAALVAALALSRASIVAIGWLARPIGDQVRLGTHMTSPRAITALSIAIIVAFSTGKEGVFTALAAGLTTVLLAQWLDQNHGGVDTAALHGSSLFVESVALAVISCRNCIW